MPLGSQDMRAVADIFPPHYAFEHPVNMFWQAHDDFRSA
jgi:hypothetical protein